jgi:hypothetical protein
MTKQDIVWGLFSITMSAGSGILLYELLTAIFP